MSVTAYVIGSVLGGLAIGAIAGGVGVAVAGVASVDDASALWFVAALAGAACVVEVLGTPIPSIRRQVNENWLGSYRGWVYGLGFGVQLGLGVLTVVTTASLYVVLIVSIIAGSLDVGILIGATFGLVRALPILTTARIRDAYGLRTHLARFAAGAARARRATAVAVAVVGVTAVVSSSAVGGVVWPT